MQRLIFFFIFSILFFSILKANESRYFVMLKNSKVNVRYGPGFEYPIKYIYKKKYLPIKVIDKKENFRRIIDQKNNSGWIHTSQLTKNKSFILLENKILFSKATKYSKPIAKISSGRLLLKKKCKLRWCKVKTDKYIGWVEIDNIWGNVN